MDISRRGFVKGLATTPLAAWLYRYRQPIEPTLGVVAEAAEAIAEEAGSAEEATAVERDFWVTAPIHMDFPKVKDGETYTSNFEIHTARFDGGDGTIEKVMPRTVQFRSHSGRMGRFGGKLILELRVPHVTAKKRIAAARGLDPAGGAG